MRCGIGYVGVSLVSMSCVGRFVCSRKSILEVWAFQIEYTTRSSAWPEISVPECFSIPLLSVYLQTPR